MPTYPLTTTAFLDLVRPGVECQFDLNVQQALSNQASGGIIAKNLAPPLWRCNYQSVPLTDAQFAKVQGLVEALQLNRKTFKAYNPKRRYPINDPTGVTLGGTVGRIGRQDGQYAVQLAGLPASYLLKIGDMFAVDYIGTTNYLLYSEDLSQSNWVKTNTTLTGSQTGPDTLTSAYLIKETVTNAAHNVAQSLTWMTGTSEIWAMSVFLRPFVGRDWVLFRYGDRAGGLNDVFFNITTGAVGTSSGTVGNPTCHILGGGWVRISMAVNTSSGVSNPFWALYIANSASTVIYAGNTSNGIYFMGGQIERYTAPYTASGYVKTLGTLGVASSNISSLHRIVDDVGITADGTASAECSIVPALPFVPWMDQNINLIVPTIEMAIVPGSVKPTGGVPLNSLSFSAIQAQAA